MVQDQDYDDDIIELTQVVPKDSSEQEQEIIELTQDPPEPEALLSDAVSKVSQESENAVPSLDQADIEAVLEKLIEKKIF